MKALIIVENGNQYEFEGNLGEIAEDINKLMIFLEKQNCINEVKKPLTQCMVGRDTECNHPQCPVTDEDAANGRYCTLPLYDYRQ